MSYGAVGEGWLTLRFDERSKTALRDRMHARYDELCQAEQDESGMDAFRESICRRFQAKKQALDQNEPSKWLQKEFADVGFSDAFVDENPVQQTLYIEMSFDNRYWEDRIMGLLDALSPLTVEGDFSFRGEDDSLWRFHFTGADWKEERGEIAYTDLDPSAGQGKSSYPALVEDVGTFEALLSEVESRLRSDERPAPQRGRQLMDAFQNQDPDGVLLALTGWSLRSLGALAGIWRDTESTVLS